MTDVHISTTQAHGLLRRPTTIHSLTKRSETSYSKTRRQRRSVTLMRGWTLELPHGTLFRPQLRSDGGSGGAVWLASCPIERGGILEIPCTLGLVEGSWWLAVFQGASKVSQSQKVVQHIASCHVTCLARESPRHLQNLEESPSLSVG